jgi:hypothetical protein
MIRRLLRLVIYIIISILLLNASSIPPGNQLERIRSFTRTIEFDYGSWTLNALWVKLGQAALNTPRYIENSTHPEIVLDYLALVRQSMNVEGQINTIFADPATVDPYRDSVDLKKQLDQLKNQLSLLQPLVESILQNQISSAIASLDLGFGGQPLPPVLYHTTPPPFALIISPRNVIRQDADISISPELSIDEVTTLEDNVDRSLNVSSLVEGIGGIGLYPTMVMETTDINWLAEVVSHEWVHNYLTLRPLGINYLTSPELRTINETTASIAGKEIGRVVIERFYPDYLPPPPAPPAPPVPSTPQEPPSFDFRTEMRITRLEVDELLAEGKITEAESYMEERRQVFWDNGYRIRKINQAYFAFHGAYADEPGGAAGTDPVGEAVRRLRSQSNSLASFLWRISWISSYSQLQQSVSP